MLLSSVTSYEKDHSQNVLGKSRIKKWQINNTRTNHLNYWEWYNVCRYPFEFELVLEGF